MNVWLSVLLSPIVFLVFYDVVFCYIPLAKGEGSLPVEFVFFMVFVDLVMVLALLFFYKFSKSQPAIHECGLIYNQSTNNRAINWQGHAFLLIASSSLLLFLVYNVFGNFDVSNIYKYNQKFYSESKVGTSWVFFFLYSFVFVALYDIYLNGCSKFKVACILILILINAATGGRGHVITYLFLFIIIYGVVWQGRHIIFMGGMVLLLIASTFLYNTLSRSGADGLSGYFGSKSRVVDMNQVYAIDDSIDYWLKHGTCYTCFIDDLSYFFIPRYFSPNKPISNAETREVYPEVAATGSTYTFGIYGSSLINLGSFSFFFIPVFYFFYARCFFSALYSKNKSYLNFFLIYCGVNSVQFVRGGVFDIRLVRLLVTFILAYFIYRLILILFDESAHIKRQSYRLYRKLV